MKKISLLSIMLLMVALFSVQFLPVAAQDEEESMTVEGTMDYTPSMVAQRNVNGDMVIRATEVEIWSGDINGTGTSETRLVRTPSGAMQAWVVTTFAEVQIGDMSGSMVQLSIWTRPSPTTDWHGEWYILSGTGDLANIDGHGTAWGSGFNPQDPEESPDIFYTGEITLLAPPSN